MKATLKIKLNNIINDYSDKYDFYIDDTVNYCYCFHDKNEIYIAKCIYDNPTNDGVFCVLHEIGHIEEYDPETENDKFHIYDKKEKEYYYCNPFEEFKATNWAIKISKKYGIKLSDKSEVEWDIYINDCCKRVKIKNNFELNWEE